MLQNKSTFFIVCVTEKEEDASIKGNNGLINVSFLKKEEKRYKIQSSFQG